MWNDQPPLQLTIIISEGYRIQVTAKIITEKLNIWHDVWCVPSHNLMWYSPFKLCIWECINGPQLCHRHCHKFPKFPCGYLIISHTNHLPLLLFDTLFSSREWEYLAVVIITPRLLQISYQQPDSDPFYCQHVCQLEPQPPERIPI